MASPSTSSTQDANYTAAPSLSTIEPIDGRTHPSPSSPPPSSTPTTTRENLHPEHDSSLLEEPEGPELSSRVLNPQQSKATLAAISAGEANSSSWAARNPGRPILPTRPVPPRPDAARLASRKVASDQKKAKQESVHAAIKKLLEYEAEKVEEIANSHDMLPEKVRKFFTGYKHFVPTRKAQLSNALLHAKAEEVNKDRPVGAKYTVRELRELVKNDPDMQDLDSDQEQQYIDELVDHRKLQNHGMRANNAAAARDMKSTMLNIFKELDNLALRTGGYFYIFGTRGHVNDSGDPTWYGTDNSMDFVEDVLHQDPDETCWLFEQWGCSRNQNIAERDSLLNVRRTCVRLIKSGLKGITGRKTTPVMNYDNYEIAIMKNMGIKLVGWPIDVPFMSPSKICTVTEIRKLRDALKDGSCHWVTMSAAEVEQHTKNIAARRAAGETVGKPRAPRGDRGKKRGPRAGGKENKRPSKRAKLAAQRKGKAPKSAATIEDSDVDDDESESSDGGD
ncbi:hypothetical protein BV22DRAFT_1014944 [Leucogyrophana mollusca]|uniref:Uncharacterized protein n=1 Tax=Leucogyrophana mollusca TaxID=85980 RepID=A0ACB8BD03_9AGAM|nr:hypothetical protein BV22DRAFT_1014944 [Leucogyrophana mollusca]